MKTAQIYGAKATQLSPELKVGFFFHLDFPDGEHQRTAYYCTLSARYLHSSALDFYDFAAGDLIKRLTEKGMDDYVFHNSVPEEFNDLPKGLVSMLENFERRSLIEALNDNASPSLHKHGFIYDNWIKYTSVIASAAIVASGLNCT